jgi:hypothetical protein
MISFARDHLQSIPSDGRMILFVIAVLALPYLVDVAFYGDFTPTHYAQEIVSDEDPQNSDDQNFSSATNDQAHLLLIETPLPDRPHISAKDRGSSWAISPLQPLISSLLISRPPPGSAIS